jgi:O-antigen/teichoic acid export membrane protein
MSIGKRVVVGSFLISSGNFIATLISAVGSIIITRLLTPSEYGLIGIALMYPLMLSGLMDFGLSNALLRYSSIDKQGRYVGVGVLIKFVVAVVSGVAVFIFADAMALSLARPYLAFMIKVLSLYTFSYILLDALGQVLLGLDEYGKAMLIGIVRNVLRVSIAVVLILLGLGVYGAVLSFSVAYTSILPLATFFVMRRARLFTFDRKVFKEILIYSIPLYIPVLLGVPAGQLINMLLTWYVSDEEIGNYRIAQNLLTPLNIVGGGILTALFSSFPLLVNEEYKLRDAVKKSAFYTSLVIPPIAFALIAFSEPVTMLIYGEAYGSAPKYLSLLALQSVLTCFGGSAIGIYLNSVGATTKTMRITILNMMFSVVIIPILIPVLRVEGFIIAQLVASLLSTLYGLKILCRDFSIKIDVVENLKALTPSAISLASTLAIKSLMGNHSTYLFIEAVAYTTILLTTIPLFVGENNLAELRDLSKSIKYFGELASKIISVELKIATTLHNIKHIKA